MIIKLEDIKNSKNRVLVCNFDKIYEDLNPQESVKINLTLTDLDTYIKIEGEILANVKQNCDICLQEYNKLLNIKIDECIYKGTLYDGETGEIELKNGDLNQDLQGEDEINLCEFVYQTIILNLPNKSVCDINCNGDVEIEKYIKKEISDSRLEVFKNIKIERKG